jgi:hypothetical protein
MKGIVFTEFIEMVEDKFGFEVSDKIIEQSALASGGAYTAVGTYDFNEMVQLLTNLSKESGLQIPDLLQAFGKHLFARFYTLYPHFFENIEGVFDFLSRIEGTIHVEVLKLYPDAQLPRIEAKKTDDDTMEIIYQSTRKLSDLAIGLIEGASEHFGEPLEITRDFIEPDGTIVHFTLQKQ